MAKFLGPGIKGQSCIEFALGARHDLIFITKWQTYWEVCAPEEATHIGIFSRTKNSPDAAPGPYNLNHIATVKRRTGNLEDWVLDQKIATHGGRYQTTVRELLEGFRADDRDPGIRRYHTAAIHYPGVAIPLKRNATTLAA